LKRTLLTKGDKKVVVGKKSEIGIRDRRREPKRGEQWRREDVESQRVTGLEVGAGTAFLEGVGCFKVAAFFGAGARRRRR
jgi:hypothetical protein